MREYEGVSRGRLVHDHKSSPGLYAAGETAGSLQGDHYIGGGGSFGPCLVFGKLVGEMAVRRAAVLNTINFLTRHPPDNPICGLAVASKSMAISICWGGPLISFLRVDLHRPLIQYRCLIHNRWNDMKDTSEVSMLLRREIEARIAGPLIQAYIDEFGRDKVMKVASDVIK